MPVWDFGFGVFFGFGGQRFAGLASAARERELVAAAPALERRRAGVGELLRRLAASAAVMNVCQIWAGNVPPATWIPCTSRIGRSLSG